jgi:N-acetylneuraminic acid mutarotase
LQKSQFPLKWQAFEQPFKRRALTMAACNGKVYAIAGLNAEGGMERTINVYDPEKKSWSKAADLPGGEMNGFTPAACVCDGKLYVNPADGKVYRLSEKGTWDEVAAVKQPRFVHRVVPIGKNTMLVLGGSAKGAVVGLVEAVEVGK